MNAPSAGTYNLDIRAAYNGANANGGTVHVEVDGANVTGTITLPKTGVWQTWQTVSKAGIGLSAGQHVLRLVFDRDYKCFFPLSVTRVTVGCEECVAISNLRVGDKLRLRNGELIPADGWLLSGPAFIDYSFVTGEADPIAYEAGDHLYAGGRQVGGAIVVDNSGTNVNYRFGGSAGTPGRAVALGGASLTLIPSNLPTGTGIT